MVFYLVAACVLVASASEVESNMLCKIDQKGSLLWMWKDWEGYDASIDKIVVDQTGNIFAVSRDGELFKYNSAGELLWDRRPLLPYGQENGIYETMVKNIIYFGDKALFITGGYFNGVNNKAFVGHMTAAGEVEWIHALPEVEGYEADYFSQIMTADKQNNIYVGGEAINRQKIYHQHDYMVAKYDEQGNEQWMTMRNIFKGDDLRWIETGEEEDVYAAGYSYDYTSQSTILYIIVYKLNRQGKPLWTIKFEAAVDDKSTTEKKGAGRQTKEREEDQMGMLVAHLDQEGIIHVVGTVIQNGRVSKIHRLAISQEGEITSEEVFLPEQSADYYHYTLAPDKTYENIYLGITVTEPQCRQILVQINENGEKGWDLELGNDCEGKISRIQTYNDVY